MGDISNSDNQKTLEGPGKPALRKAKSRKSTDQIILESANKYWKVAHKMVPYEDALRKASFGYEVERQMRHTPSSIQIMKDAMRRAKDMDRFVRFDSSRALSIDSFGATAVAAYEKTKDVFESLSRYNSGQFGTYQDIVRNTLYLGTVKDITGDMSIAQHQWMNTLNMSPLESLLKEIKAGFPANLKDLFKISSEMRRAYADLPAEEILIQDDHSVVCAGKAYEVSDIEKVLKEQLENAGFLTDVEIGKKNFEVLLSEIKKLRDPSLKRILYDILVPIFLSIIMLFVTPHLENIQKNLFSKNKTAATKFIEREIPKTLPDNNILYDFRFVTASILNVRSRNCQRSDLIGKLYFGSVVRIIQRNKNWTLVEWRHQDNDLLIQGWVFSRYLKKFKIGVGNP